MQFIRITSGFNLKEFDCGEPELNKYLSQYARRNDRKGISRCIVAVDDQKVAGYYCLSMAEIKKTSLSEEQARGLPGYPIGAVRITRLARSVDYKGKGLGAILLKHAFETILDHYSHLTSPAFAFVVVDAKNDAAVYFYQKYGFVRYVDKPNSLVMTIETIRKAVPER